MSDRRPGKSAPPGIGIAPAWCHDAPELRLHPNLLKFTITATWKISSQLDIVLGYSKRIGEMEDIQVAYEMYDENTNKERQKTPQKPV